MEGHPELNNLPKEASELPVLNEQNVGKVESIHDPGKFEKNPKENFNSASARDSETSSIKVIKKKKTATFQAPNKSSTSMNVGDAVEKTKTQKIKEKKSKKSIDLAEKGLQDNLQNSKDEKIAKKKKLKTSGDTKEGVESEEVKPKKVNKSKKENDADIEKDSVKEPNVTCDSQVLPSDNSVLEPILNECNNDNIVKDVKKKETKRTEDKGNNKEPARSLSDEEWELLFQSAIDRVLNTPLDQLVTQGKEVVQNKTKHNENKMQEEVQEEEEKECGNMDAEGDPQNTSEVAISILNGKQSVGPDQIQENSRNYDFPIEDQHIQMIECAEVQELNENTPEGSELEFNGEEDKKHQHTPVVLMKKAVKKADRSNAAKGLAPRQLLFPKPAKESEKQGKLKENKEKNKMIEVVEKKEKMKNLPEKSDIITNHPPKSKKQLLMERQIEETGTWVQCSNTTCQKWRFLQDINDPTEIDENWICEMNNDTNYNSCEKKEQDYDESEHFYTKYSEGSVVWARMVGYPWWPAMVEIDPDTETFFELVSENSMFPSHYHVVYLDNKVSRAWVKASAILPFHRGGGDLNKNLYLTKKSKGPNFKKEVDAAKQNALAALELPTKERLKQFSFSVRFKGKWAEEETKSNKVKKYCRVKLTTKKSKNKMKKPEPPIGKSVVNHDLEMYMLDSSTVNEMLSEEPDSILKGIEDVLDSLGSDILSDDNDEEYIPTNSERDVLTESTESRRDVSPEKEPKGIKRKKSSKQGEKTKKSRQQKTEGVSRKDSDENKKQKVKKNKKFTVNENENKNNSLVRQSVELVEMKTEVSDVSESDTCVKKSEDVSGKNFVKSTTTTMKFDSDIFTMELDDEELSNPKHKKKMSNRATSPVTPERKSKSKPVAKTEKKKSKKNLFAVPEAAPNEKPSEEYAKNSSDKMVSPNNLLSVKQDDLENKSSVESELTSEEISLKNDVKCSTTDDSKVLEKNVNRSLKKKACPKKVSFSAPATVTVESKATVMAMNNEGDFVSCKDEQTVPDMQTQESDNEDDFSLDLPICEQKSEIQEVRITSVSTLPVAVDTEDVYDSDPFDLMEE